MTFTRLMFVLAVALAFISTLVVAAPVQDTSEIEELPMETPVRESNSAFTAYETSEIEEAPVETPVDETNTEFTAYETSEIEEAPVETPVDESNTDLVAYETSEIEESPVEQTTEVYSSTVAPTTYNQCIIACHKTFTTCYR